MTSGGYIIDCKGNGACKTTDRDYKDKMLALCAAKPDAEKQQCGADYYTNFPATYDATVQASGIAQDAFEKLLRVVKGEDAYAVFGGVEVHDLIKRLKDDPDPKKRQEAAKRLGDIGGEEVIEPLIFSLAHDDDDWVRNSAAHSLARLSAERATEQLIASLADRHFVVRATSAYGLGRLGAREAVWPLIPLLNDPDELVRSQAELALINIGDPRAADALRECCGEAKVVELYRSAAKRAKKEGELTQAIVYYQELMKFEPRDHSHPLNSGHIYREMGEPDKAEKSYGKSLRLCPDCDGLAAKRALAELKAIKGGFSRPASFVGVLFADILRPGQESNVEREARSVLGNLVFESLKAEKFDVSVADLGRAKSAGAIDEDDIVSRETYCAALAGAMKQKACIYAAVEKIKGSEELSLGLFYVEQKSAEVTHSASKRISIDDLRAEPKDIAGDLARKLAIKVQGGVLSAGGFDISKCGRNEACVADAEAYNDGILQVCANEGDTKKCEDDYVRQFPSSYDEVVKKIPNFSKDQHTRLEAIEDGGSVEEVYPGKGTAQGSPSLKFSSPSYPYRHIKQYDAVVLSKEDGATVFPVYGYDKLDKGYCAEQGNVCGWSPCYEYGDINEDKRILLHVFSGAIMSFFSNLNRVKGTHIWRLKRPEEHLDEFRLKAFQECRPDQKLDDEMLIEAVVGSPANDWKSGGNDAVEPE